MFSPHFVLSLVVASVIFLGAGTVAGQGYPNKPIRIVVGAVGGGNDFAARVIAQGISGPLGQQVIVDNRAGSIIPPEVVSKAPPDGYTLLVAGASHWIRPLLATMPWDPVRDFSAITLISRDASLVVVHPALAVKSIKELIDIAKAKPQTLNYGSTGVGGPQHLGAELFKSMAAVNLVHVPYKGTALALTALIGGEVQVMITDAGGAAPHVKSGKLRALAVTSPERSVLFPDLPTVAASGLPGYEMTGMICMRAPAKTPEAIINRLRQEVIKLLNQAEVKERFLAAGGETVGSTPQELAATMKSDMARMDKVIKAAGIRAD